MPDSETAERDIHRAKAKRVAVKKQEHAVEGRLGLLIDGTGHEYDKVANRAGQLSQLGYEPSMIFVNTSLEVALYRDEKRSRSVQTSLVKKKLERCSKQYGQISEFLWACEFLHCG